MKKKIFRNKKNDIKVDPSVAERSDAERVARRIPTTKQMIKFETGKEPAEVLKTVDNIHSGIDAVKRFSEERAWGLASHESEKDKFDFGSETFSVTSWANVAGSGSIVKVSDGKIGLVLRSGWDSGNPTLDKVSVTAVRVNDQESFFGQDTIMFNPWDKTTQNAAETLISVDFYDYHNYMEVQKPDFEQDIVQEGQFSEGNRQDLLKLNSVYEHLMGDITAEIGSTK